jgi:hypothetical protein
MQNFNLSPHDVKKIQDVEKTSYPEHQWKFVGKSFDEVLAMPFFKSGNYFYKVEKNWYMIGRVYKELIYVEDLAASYGAISSIDDFMGGVNLLKEFGCVPIYCDSLKETSFPLLVAMEKYGYISFIECTQTGHRHYRVCLVIEPCKKTFEISKNITSNENIYFSNTMSSVASMHSLSQPFFRSSEGILYGKNKAAPNIKNKKMYVHELELDKSTLCRMDLTEDRARAEQEFALLTDSPKWRSFYTAYAGIDWSDYILDDFGKKLIPENTYVNYDGLVWSDKAILKSNFIGVYEG